MSESGGAQLSAVEVAYVHSLQVWVEPDTSSKVIYTSKQHFDSQEVGLR